MAGRPSIGYVTQPLDGLREELGVDGRSEGHCRTATLMKNMLPNGYDGEMRLCLGRVHGRLHHGQHGGGGGIGLEDAEGSGGTGAEARRAVLQGLSVAPAQAGVLCMHKLFNNRHVLGLLFMLPAGVLLLLFLTYPLGLGTWLGFTDAKIGRAGRVGRPRELQVPRRRPASRGSRSSTRSSTRSSRASSSSRSGCGWRCCSTATCRSSRSSAPIVLLPFIVPTALSAIAFWWIYDAQFSVISWALMKMGLIDHYIDFLGDPWNARFSVIAANIWRGVPFVAICLLAGLQTISPSLYEAAALDGATPWQRFRFVTLPLLTPIIAVVMTFSVLFTFTDFQLIYVITRGGPLNATHLMATLSFQRAISGGSLGEGAALATLMVPFLLAAILFSYFGLQRRAWQQGGEGLMMKRSSTSPTTRRRDELPRVAAAARGDALHAARRLPLRAALPVLLDGDDVVQAQRGAALARGQPVLGRQPDARRTSTTCSSRRRIRSGCGTR